jgi:hypothetical protein
MATDIGYIQYEYQWSQGHYYRRLLFGPARWEHWSGKLWQPANDGPPD